MLIRIGFIIAIVAGLTVAGLNFTQVKEKITTLQTNLKSETEAKTSALGAQAKAEKSEKLVKKELDETKTELADTQTARDKAVTEAETQTKRASKLSEDLVKSKGETSDAQAELATGIKPDQVKTLIADFKAAKEANGALTEANHDLHLEVASLTNRLAKYEDPEYTVRLPQTAHGKVLVSDPKWDFVVLDFGAKSGALEGGVLLVNRNGRLVAKVQIRNIQPDRCIANVLPNWKLGDVTEGDQVIP
jgi:hypothetical protein